MARRVRSSVADLQHGAEAEQEGDERRLRPLPDGGGADHGQGHEDVHVDLARAQAEDGGAGDEHAAGDHGGAEQPGRGGRRDGARQRSRPAVKRAGDGVATARGSESQKAGAGPRRGRRRAVAALLLGAPLDGVVARDGGRRGTRRAAPL